MVTAPYGASEKKNSMVNGINTGEDFDPALIPFFTSACGVSLVGTVPGFVLLMTGEAVEDIHSIFTDIVDYSRLFR